MGCWYELVGSLLERPALNDDRNCFWSAVDLHLIFIVDQVELETWRAIEEYISEARWPHVSRSKPMVFRHHETLGSSHDPRFGYPGYCSRYFQRVERAMGSASESVP